MNNIDWKEHEIGGLWVTKSKKGDKFLNGKVKIGQRKGKLFLFPNRFKKGNQNAPDFRVYFIDEENDPYPSKGASPKFKKSQPRAARQEENPFENQEEQFSSEGEDTETIF